MTDMMLAREVSDMDFYNNQQREWYQHPVTGKELSNQQSKWQ